MQQLLDFFVRVGDVTLGILFTIIWIALLIIIIIEIIDFLIVDPIRRTRQNDDNEYVVNTSEED